VKITSIKRICIAPEDYGTHEPKPKMASKYTPKISEVIETDPKMTSLGSGKILTVCV